MWQYFKKIRNLVILKLKYAPGKNPHRHRAKKTIEHDFRGEVYGVFFVREHCRSAGILRQLETNGGKHAGDVEPLFTCKTFMLVKWGVFDAADLLISLSYNKER